MTTLNIASKANQATTFPTLLVASYVNESDKHASIDINFREVESLKPGDDASVELFLGDAKPVYGATQVVNSLMGAFPILQGKNESLVGTLCE